MSTNESSNKCEMITCMTCSKDTCVVMLVYGKGNVQTSFSTSNECIEVDTNISGEILC